MIIADLHYKAPVIRRYSDKWFVEYYYRCPADLLSLGYKEWQRFKVYEDINRYKGPEKEEYAKLLCDSVLIALRDEKYNPFDAIRDKIKEVKSAAALVIEKRITMVEAAELYLKEKIENKLSDNTIKVIRTLKNLIVDYCVKHDLKNTPVDFFNEKEITDLLKYWSIEKGWTNTTYNNNRGHIYTFLYWLHEKEFHPTRLKIHKTPSRPKSQTATKFYEGKIREKIQDELSKHPELDILCKYVYYTCMRNVEELGNIKIKWISEENRTIFVPEDVSKESQRYIPICEELHELFQKNNVYKSKGEFYLIGKDGLPAESKPDKNYFNRRYKKIKDALGLTPEYTIYGWKHTRVVDLKRAGYTDAQIQMITGHTSSESYDHYTRGFGLNIDEKLKQRTIEF